MIRKVYIRLALNVIKQNRVGLFARICCHYLLVKISHLIGRPLCGPLISALVVTYRCNLRCSYCNMPEIASEYMRADRPELDTAALLGVIDEFVSLGVKAIVFTGGEPLLRDDIYELLTYAHQRGLITHFSTNGLLVGRDEAKRLVETGVESISVSVDGSTSDIHERVRKNSAAFGGALNAIRHLVAERGRQKSSVRIKVLTVVTNHNIDDIPDLIRFFKNEQVDCVELMPCQPLSKGCIADEPFSYDEDFLSKVDSLVNGLISDKAYRNFIDNSDAYLKLFRKSFEGKKSSLRCYSGYAFVTVDCYGNVLPCLPWINWRSKSINIAGRTLAGIWKSAEYSKIREITKHCGRCYLNCHAELSITMEVVESTLKRYLLGITGKKKANADK